MVTSADDVYPAMLLVGEGVLVLLVPSPYLRSLHKLYTQNNRFFLGFWDMELRNIQWNMKVHKTGI